MALPSGQTDETNGDGGDEGKEDWVVSPNPPASVAWLPWSNSDRCCFVCGCWGCGRGIHHGRRAVVEKRGKSESGEMKVRGRRASDARLYIQQARWFCRTFERQSTDMLISQMTLDSVTGQPHLNRF